MSALRAYVGSHWFGTSELWLDELGDELTRGDATLDVHAAALEYSWTFDGKVQRGRIEWSEAAGSFQDTFHSSKPMPLSRIIETRCLLDFAGRYGEGDDWGWAIALCLRPTGLLVLQMTNIAPWGERTRAVRMTLRRKLDVIPS